MPLTVATETVSGTSRQPCVLVDCHQVSERDTASIFRTKIETTLKTEMVEVACALIWSRHVRAKCPLSTTHSIATYNKIQSDCVVLLISHTDRAATSRLYVLKGNTDYSDVIPMYHCLTARLSED